MSGTPLITAVDDGNTKTGVWVAGARLYDLPPVLGAALHGLGLLDAAPLAYERLRASAGRTAG